MNKIIELLKDIEEKTKELQEMINEPATKEWFEKYENTFTSNQESETHEQGYQPEKN